MQLCAWFFPLLNPVNKSLLWGRCLPGYPLRWRRRAGTLSETRAVPSFRLPTERVSVPHRARWPRSARVRTSQSSGACGVCHSEQSLTLFECGLDQRVCRTTCSALRHLIKRHHNSEEPPWVLPLRSLPSPQASVKVSGSRRHLLQRDDPSAWRSALTPKVVGGSRRSFRTGAFIKTARDIRGGSWSST